MSPVPVTSVALTKLMPRLVFAASSKFTAPLTDVALLEEPKPVYVSVLAAVPACVPVSAKLAVPVMSPLLSVATDVKPSEYVTPLPADWRVVSSKLDTTLLIAPLPVTLVTLAKLIPRLLMAVSSKPCAPVTDVALLDEPKPVYVSALAAVPACVPVSAKLAVPVMSPLLSVATDVKPSEYVTPLPADWRVVSSKLDTTLLIAPLPVTLVTLAKLIPRLLFAVSSKFTAPVTVVVSAVENP